MNRIPLLPLFVTAVGAVLIPIVIVMITDNWWALGAAVAVLLAALTFVGAEVLAYLRD